MKKKKVFLLAAISAISALACNREAVPSSHVEEGIPVELTVSVPSPALTKATSVGDETAVGRLQVFVFRESDGALEATASASASSLTMSTTTGSKKVAALVNAPAVSVTTLTELEAKVSDLADNGSGALVMYGMETKQVTTDASVNITVTRLVAKIRIQKITNAIAQTEYASETMSIDGIFVLNAAGNALYTRGSYAPTKWYNFKEMKGECSGLLSDTLTGKTLAKDASLSETYTYYCYANPTTNDSSEDNDAARFTRLVVKATIAGKTAYYPMSIQNIEANHVYTVTELKITRLGSDDPDSPITTGEATFTVTVASWEDGTTTDYTI
ncbi:MAG: hypothetical protein MJY56_03210 [Bacteroidales bacterium]|nr:hypothetical protein [Bacteroidales bacterium]